MLYAICDVAEDLVARFAITHGAEKSYLSYEDMLADPQLEAVIHRRCVSRAGGAGSACRRQACAV